MNNASKKQRALVIIVTFLLYFLSGCQNTSNNQSVDIQVSSIQDAIVEAESLARDWESDSELFQSRIVYIRQSGTEIDNFVSFRFESGSNLDEYLRVECRNQRCVQEVVSFGVVGDRVFSLYQDGISPLGIDEIRFDSQEILEIALDSGLINLEISRYRIDILLMRDLENRLYWEVLYSTYQEHVDIWIDPYSGDFISID